MRSEGETQPSSIRGFKEKEQLPRWSPRVDLVDLGYGASCFHDLILRTELGGSSRPQVGPKAALDRPLTHLDALEQNLLPCAAAAWLNPG